VTWNDYAQLIVFARMGNESKKYLSKVCNDFKRSTSDSLLLRYIEGLELYLYYNANSLGILWEVYDKLPQNIPGETSYKCVLLSINNICYSLGIEVEEKIEKFWSIVIGEKKNELSSYLTDCDKMLTAKKKGDELLDEFIHIPSNKDELLDDFFHISSSNLV